VDLPTYTNIWRIEKRLYKLYDFRLPAPLPINWIAVFTGITVPYIVLLVAIGLPLNHTLVWLYVLPPGLLTWLTTRPVIESKRLPELLESQIRYLTEPRVWCRLAPLNEKDQIVVTVKVWHSRRVPPRRKARAGTVALRERGTLVRRDRGTVPPAAPGITAVPAEDLTPVRQAAAASPAVPARSRTRLQGRGTGPRTQQSQVARQVQPRRARDPQQLPAAQRTQAPPAQPALATVPQAAGAVPQAPASADQAPAAKPGRFRLAALRSGPAGPAPALPPGVALRQPAGSGEPRSAAYTRPGQADAVWPGQPSLARPGFPVTFAAPSLGPAVAPVPSAMPVHATPDVFPAEQVPGWPVASDAPQRQADAPDMIASPADAPRVIDPPADAPDIAADAPDIAADAPDIAARAALGEAGAPPIEVAHAGPVPRPVQAQVPRPVPAEARGAQETRGASEVQPPPVAQPDVPVAQPDVRAPAVKAVADTQDRKVPSIERALSGPSRDRNLSWHGKVRIVTGAGAAPGPGARDQEALDRARARLLLKAPKRVLMLGCTSGAGQTVTTLMTGHILASLREHPVAAVDLHDGTLARYSAPAAWLEEILHGKPPRQRTPVRPDGLHPTPKPTPARLDVIASHDPLADGDEIKLAVQLSRHYLLTMLDPGATGLTKLLKITDQLVVVVPASMEAAGALADTRDWLDAHGFADLAAHSVTLINGVSRRSLADVEHAESVARGRCRAIVRVPWDDMLPVGLTGPSTLRPQTRVAYTALAGVLVAGLAAAPVRANQ
jgi:hypothetical protein